MSKIKIAGHASGSGTLTIQAPDTSSSRTITLPDATGTLLNSDGSAASLTAIPAANITGTLPAIDGSSLTGIAGRRNIIINGDMKVSQRGTSWAAITSGVYSLDRWLFYHNLGAYTVTQDSTGADGFANSFKIDCTTADASVVADDYLLLRYTFEGQDLQCWKKGTASAESVTLSFWVKSNKTGDLAIHLFDADNTRGIGSTPTINSADTWEKKTITFAGDTTGAFNDDNAASLWLDFWFDGGSTYTGGSTPTSWEAVADSDRGAGTTLALADSTSNYLNITGVQLELGTAATEFEHRSYGEELALCQRYCTIMGGGYKGAKQNGTTVLTVTYDMPVAMRAEPTTTNNSVAAAWMDHDSYSGSTTSYTTTVSNMYGGGTVIRVNWGNFSGATDNRMALITSNAEITFDAEL